jgi:hypothetical protein
MFSKTKYGMQFINVQEIDKIMLYVPLPVQCGIAERQYKEMVIHLTQ